MIENERSVVRKKEKTANAQMSMQKRHTTGRNQEMDRGSATAKDLSIGPRSVPDSRSASPLASRRDSEEA
jgi:hypothetical protein